MLEQNNYETPAFEAGAQTEEQNPQLKKGLHLVNRENDQVVNEPQENPELETPEAAPNAGDDEVVDEPQADSESTAQEAAESVDGDADMKDEEEKHSSSSEDEDADSATTTEKKGVKKSKAKDAKKYKPEYSKEHLEFLNKVTDISKAEIQRVMDDEKIPTFQYGKGLNCVIDLSAAMKNGIEILTPVVNRTHGKDQITTGDSVRTWGAQQLLLVITREMALAANIQVSRFSNNPSKDQIGDNALVAINGNGRLNYVYGLKEDERPQLYATFIEPDALKIYNPAKAMEVINTDRSMWKTQDLVQKRILDEGEKSHQGWCFVNALVKKGYMYQAACQTATLNTDRINKKDVNTGSPTNIFTYFNSAQKIHEAMVKKFGEGDDKTLKTKEFSKEISELWKKLLKHKGEQWATEQFVEFIKNFREDKKNEILNAKNQKNGPSKDDTRKTILNEQFNQFLGKKSIEI